MNASDDERDETSKHGRINFNSRMHDNNFYKNNKPDFTALAEKYNDFAQFCTFDTQGNAKLRWHEPGAVRALTTTLLRHDWSLDVQIPDWCLVPRLPNRFNYLLHIRDALRYAHLNGDVVRGIDVGAGASCIYALLGAKAFNWHFVAAEADVDSVQCARANVRVNNMSEKINVTQIDSTQPILSQVLAQHPQYKFTFVMCNPPFFDAEQLNERLKDDAVPEDGDEQEEPLAKRRLVLPTMSARSSRPPPLSRTEASSNEVCAPGGELEFVTAMIDDSIALRDRIPLFTTMLGRKASLSHLIRRLVALGARHTSCVLSQGRTLRWVLTWTFTDVMLLPDELARERFVPTKCKSNVNAEEMLKRILDDASLQQRVLANGVIECIAWEDTWTRKGRRKRAKQINSENSTVDMDATDDISRLPLVKFNVNVERQDELFGYRIRHVYAENANIENQIVQYIRQKINDLSSTTRTPAVMQR